VIDLTNKNILITGGTGSFGKACAKRLLQKFKPSKLIILSRDEFKQSEMESEFSELDESNALRFFLGDVRDSERLNRAFKGVDYVIHAAALKQVPAAEYNPSEFVKTNIEGAQNVINAAANQAVKRVIALSTDKACNPVNLYGATKLCSDKLFVSANGFFAYDETRFSVVRYGNVMGSRGSVIPYFLSQRMQKRLTVTDPRMTRFWITLNQGVNFVLTRLTNMIGGEIFVPKLPSMSVMNLARSLCPECEILIIGMRPGEKIHEVMISKDDAKNTREFEDYYAILPDNKFFSARYDSLGGVPVATNFEYNSESNPIWITPDELRKLMNETF
jgi:UDP-N-acetylglucosamine 4,6-dehydratase